MARTTAEIEVKVNARALNDLERTLGDAFDPARAEGLTSATEDLNTAFEETGDVAKTLAESLDKAGDSVKKFKKLRDELKSVREEAKRVNSEFRRMQNLGGGGPRPPGGRGPGGGGGGGGGGGAPPGGGGGSGAAGANRSFSAWTTGLKAVPYAGMALGAMTMMMRGAYQSHLGRAGARRGSYAARRQSQGGALGASGFERQGEGFGYAPSESNQMYGQFMSQAGQPLEKGSFGAALGAQQSYGVGLETSGSMMHSFMRAGGENQGGARREFKEQLAAAVTLGLDGSELTGYMQQSAELLSQQVEIGARDLDMSTYQSAELNLSEIVGGLQGGRITRGFSQGVSEMGYAGSGGATELQLAMAAGYQPGEGMESYHAARRKMQDVGTNPELMESYLARYTSEDVGGIETRTAATQRALEAVGVRVHADTAQRIVEGDKTALEGVASGELTLGARGVDSSLVKEAGFERRRADIGGTPKLVGTMHKLTEATIQMQQTAANLSSVMLGMATVIEGIAKGAAAAASVVDPLIALIKRMTGSP